MSLLIGFEPGGLDPAVVNALDDIIAPLQVWAGKVDGINAAERLNELTTGLASLPTVPTGVIFGWGTETAPTGYVLLQGQAISRTTYVNLYTLWGTTYGAGDGSSTFNVPNLQQRFLLGKAASGTGSTLGSTGGAINHTHTGPSHSHSISSDGSHTHGPGSLNTDTNPGASERITVDVNEDGLVDIAAAGSHDHDVDGGVTSSNGSHDHSGSTGSGGTGATGSNNPPYFVVNFIVKT